MTKLLSWLLGGGLSAIGAQLNTAYKNKLDAKNDGERIEAEKQIAQLEARQAVLIAEQGNWATRWIRPAFALPFILYNFKIIVYDKMLGWGVTDALSEQFWQLQMIVFGAYFLTRPFEKR
jgi:hypothetical protein